MLYKYNMYRELLFVGIMFLVAAYCSGLVRDHAISYNSDDDFDEDAHDECDLDIDFEDERQPPPPYKQEEVPSYDESQGTRPKTTTGIHKEQKGGEIQTSPPRSVAFQEKKNHRKSNVKSSPMPDFTDDLDDDSDMDPEFSLDKNVPDFMHLSDESESSDIDLPSSDLPSPNIEDLPPEVGATGVTGKLVQEGEEGEMADLEDSESAGSEPEILSAAELFDIKDSGVDTG